MCNIVATSTKSEVEIQLRFGQSTLWSIYDNVNGMSKGTGAQPSDIVAIGLQILATNP
jgi:hypothetical protein